MSTTTTRSGPQRSSCSAEMTAYAEHRQPSSVCSGAPMPQQAHAVGGAERVGLEGAGDAVVDVDPVGLQAEGGEAWRWAVRSCPSVLTRA